MRFAWFFGGSQLGMPVKNEFLGYKKGCPKRDTRKKVKKKLWIRVGGAHINVTTLERNTYFF